jgi:uncharacterized membrane protein YkvA (DUF1232 family)
MRNDIRAFFGMLGAWFRGKYKPRKRFYFVLVGSLLYFILPFDLISDLAPLVGITDDAVVLGILIKFIADEVRRYREQFAKHDNASTDTLTLPSGEGNTEG